MNPMPRSTPTDPAPGGTAASPVTVDWVALHGDAFRGVPCLVTGGAGFIGSHIVAALVALGADVTVLDDLSEGSAEHLPAEAKLLQADIADADARALDGVRFVFHLAAKVSVPRSVDDPVGYHLTNATGTLRILEAARAASVERVIYSASSSAYGDQPTLPKHEEMAERPMSPYAASKLAGEQYIRSYAAVYPLDAVSLRYFNIFGPRQKADSAYAGVIAAFARDLLDGRAPTIYGDGSFSRDFTYVANVVHANLLAARHPAPLVGEVFNVGIGQSVTILELAREMAAAVGRRDLEPILKPARAGDVPHSLADLTRIRRELGYSPIADFAPGLRQTLQWYTKERLSTHQPTL
jgi:UDP-glucose 4-epimerase